MKKTLLFLLLFAGAGAMAYYFYINNKGFRAHVDNFFSDSHPADTVKTDTLIPKKKNNKHIVRKTKPKPVVHQKRVHKAGPYKEIDDYARKAPVSLETDLDELTDYLVKPAKTELEKVRLIFSWIAFHINYDANGYNSGNYGDLSPNGVLKRKLAVCEGYSALFQAMCESAGLEGEKLSGYAKGYSYRTGQIFSKTNHAWNVVKINGKWKLFDVTWASGYGINQNGKLVSHAEFDDYWFDTNPYEFVFSHLPEEPKWQLTNPNLTLQQFSTLPYVYHSFFKLGFNGTFALNNALNNNIKEFAETYSVDYPIKVVNLPYSKEIKANKKIELKIESEYAEEIAAINNGKWNYFVRNNDTFTLLVSPEPGKLEVSVKFNPQDNNFDSCIIYEVK